MSESSAAEQFPWADFWPEITDERLRLAFARITRSLFVPEELRPWAEQDTPLPIGEGQTISQPFMVAWMTQVLALQPGDKTLEIGTGSGFQTAILCEMTTRPGESPGEHVYSIERFSSLAQRAADLLHQLGYHPHLAVGDGAQGWPDAAPFAAIILTAAPTHLPRPLWEQLAEGGRLVAPIGETAEEQRLWVLRKKGGKIRARSLGDVRFVPLISPILSNPEQWVEL
jgi:protein-L-isoaspartate(D-aspartate) O-methyltransferase